MLIAAKWSWKAKKHALGECLLDGDIKDVATADVVTNGGLFVDCEHWILRFQIAIGLGEYAQQCFASL
jgi:hypothetical protein